MKDAFPCRVISTNVNQSRVMSQTGKCTKSRGDRSTSHDLVIVGLEHSFCAGKIRHYPEIIQSGRTYSDHNHPRVSSFSQ